MDNNTVLSMDNNNNNEEPNKQWIARLLRRSAKHLLALVITVALLPVLFYDDSKKFRCAYVLLLMAANWMIEPMSLYATALMPVALFPLLGVLSTGEVCAPYMKATNMMFIGGLLMAIAIEKCNLHKRIALRVLLVIGTGVSRIMLGIMLVTMFLSMWLNNTATTAMMVPIVDAMLHELEPPKLDGKSDPSKDNSMFGKQRAVIRKALLLSIAYSANIGGTGTLTGTGTNLVLQGLYDELYPKSTDLTFSRWFIYAAPGMLICTLFAWAFLWLFFIRNNNKLIDDSKGKMKTIIQTKCRELGPLSFQETAVIFHFVLLVLLWFFREPEIFTGWAGLIVDDGSIKDATPAILIALSMFLFPSNLHQFYDEKPPKTIDTLLDWPTVHKKMSWGVVLLLGGGFALAEGIQKSGLSTWLGDQLSHFETLSPRGAMVALTIIAAMITELASNVATASVILPVVNQLAVKMGVHPLLMMMPVTIAVSFAFMFPVATPPNAIVFESLGLNTFDMIKPGFVMNIICIGIELALINSWGQLIFDLNDLPSYINNSTSLMT